MRPTFSAVWLLLAIVPSLALAASEAKIRCKAGRCDYVLTGGASPDRNLLLQPNESDPRSGRLKLNGFAEIFPEWRPPTERALDRIFTWEPSATLVDGSSVRLFDVAPRLTTGNSTGSAIFSVTGSLTRTGSDNPLYQWTGFFSGTHFRSAASAICIGGPSKGSACTGDAGCPESTCEGGSPLYQDAFFDGSSAEQLRGHAIQNTWIPISFLSKPTLTASLSCDGGKNHDKPCRTDAQCTGGACQAAFLDQDKFFSLYAQPGFHEFAGATLINRDYAAVAIDNPNVSGAPEVKRFTGLLCDPYRTDWSRLPAETERNCIVSLGSRIKSRHAGAFRIGDASEPQDALEVNGAISLDTGGDGSLNGSKTAGAALNLNANTSPDAPGPLRLGATVTSVPASGWTMLLADGARRLDAPSARAVFASVEGDWTVSADSDADAQGVDGSRFAPSIRAESAAAGRSTGRYRQALMSPSFAAGDQTSGDGGELRVAAVEGTRMQPVLSRGEGGAGVVLGESLAVVDTPRVDAGTRIADRRGLAFLDKQGAGTQDAAVAVDVADQSTTSYAAALRSAISKGEGKWNLELTGTADSSIAGSLLLGASAGMVPRARLHVREETLGAEVARVESGAAGGPSMQVFQHEATTVGIDPVTMHVFRPEAGSTYLVEARVVARCSEGAGCDGESGAYVRRILVRAGRGGTKCVAQAGQGGDFTATEVEAWDAALECSGAELRLRVKGDAARTVRWQDTLVVQGLGS